MPMKVWVEVARILAIKPEHGCKVSSIRKKIILSNVYHSTGLSSMSLGRMTSRLDDIMDVVP